jgi:hypothetical protein
VLAGLFIAVACVGCAKKEAGVTIKKDGDSIKVDITK